MGERMKDERFAEWVCTDEAGELGWGEPSHNEISELWFALAAERECVEQEKAAKAKWIITAGLRQSKVDELEAALKDKFDTFEEWKSGVDKANSLVKDISESALITELRDMAERLREEVTYPEDFVDQLEEESYRVAQDVVLRRIAAELTALLDKQEGNSDG